MVVVRTIINHVPNSLFSKWEVSNSLAVPVTGTYDPQDPYVDNRQYQDAGASYSSAPLSSASSATATSGSQNASTRERERERSERERHHRSRR
jgi:2-methylisocitrate lyase-like PEP mutase family enzyme